jgi:hypothetical protein
MGCTQLPCPPHTCLQGPRHVLDNSRNNFERGAVDTFLLLKQRSLGPLKAVRVGHNNHGAAPGAQGGCLGMWGCPWDSRQGVPRQTQP